MMIGTLAITGVGIPLTGWIGFAGFASKDAVIESAFAGTNAAHMYAFWMLVIAALMTSFYSWRLIFLTFYGKPRGDKHTHEHAHESPKVMLIPLGVLALGSVFAGAIWYGSFFGHTDQVAKFYGVPYAEEQSEAGHGDAHGEDHADAAHGEDHSHGEHHYVYTGAPGEGAVYMRPENTVMADAHDVPKWVKLSPFVAMLIGFGLSFLFYIHKPSLPRTFAETLWPVYNFIYNKWYFDEIYDAVFVKPSKAIGRFLWTKGDGATIDGGINGLAMGIIPFFTRLAGRAQSGYLFHYAFAMVLGITILVTWMTIGGGAE
jgi:NADH-quinone oxidoreductase subunit L